MMTFISATVFGNQSSEEHYRQIEEDFAIGHIPEIELLAKTQWRVGRCVYKENPGKLYPAIFQIQSEANGPYYNTNYKIHLHYFLNRNPDYFDKYPSDALRRSVFLKSNDPSRGPTFAISDHRKVLRSFEEILLVSLQGAMCYFFVE